MRSTFAWLFAFACFVAAAGCHSSTPAAPDMAMPPSMARCTMPTAVTCTDESIQDLTLFKTASTRMVTNMPDGNGWATEIDATGGAGSGITPKESYVYLKFTDTGLMAVSVGDEAAFNSMDWDIAFRRFIIRLNSGVSGPSCVDGARTGPNTDYDSLAAEPPGLTFSTEVYYTDSCTLIPDGSGLGSPGTVLQSFWMYPGCLQMTGNVFVIRLADGREVKLVVTHYYETMAQMDCDNNNMITVAEQSQAAHVGVRWAFLGQ
jgi:hypothetical protein